MSIKSTEAVSYTHLDVYKRQDKPTEPSDKPTDPDAPKTGDEANILLWIVLGLMGAAGAAAVVVFVRKRRHN